MIQETLELLEIAKQARLRGEHIDIALGKHKVPLTIKDAIRQIRNG